MIPIEGHKNLYRDEKSGAIVNSNTFEYNQYIRMRSERQKQKDEIAFSTGLSSDRYDKFPNKNRTTDAIPGQQGYSETIPNKNLKKNK